MNDNVERVQYLVMAIYDYYHDTLVRIEGKVRGLRKGDMIQNEKHEWFSVLNVSSYNSLTNSSDVLIQNKFKGSYISFEYDRFRALSKEQVEKLKRQEEFFKKLRSGEEVVCPSCRKGIIKTPYNHKDSRFFKCDNIECSYSIIFD